MGAHPDAVEVSIARLPATGRELFGREAELAWLDACWRDRVHVVSVVAFGGVGKSALVNRWLAGMRDAGWRGAERVYGWSFYSQGTDRLGSSDEMFAEALRWFGDEGPAPTSPWDRGQRLAALVKKERAILVLDGVEPLQWGPGVEEGKLKDPALQALVKELGAQNRGLCIITTRIAVADLEGLGGDKVQALGLDHLSKEAGAELLKAREVEGAEEELQAAAEEYEGHSLALTLLGTYLRKAHKGDIRKRDLIPPMPEKPARRMMAIYEGWFKDKPELAILRMLGLFDRPAPADEIAAVTEAPAIEGLTDALEGLPRDAWNEAVSALRDVGLLAGGSGAEEADRLDAHPLVREHFGEQLRREQPEAWREGHRRLYVYLQGKAKPLPDTVEEMAPLYAAVVHGCLAGKNQEALDEVLWERIEREGEAFSTKKLGAFGSEVAVLSAFFDPPWAPLAPGLDDAAAAFVLSSAGFALRALGRLLEAAGLMRIAMEQYIVQERWQSVAISASNLSDLLQSRGDIREALEQARKSVELADRSGDAAQRMFNRTTLAAVLHATGLRNEAAVQFEEAERMEKEMVPAYPLLSSLQGFQYCDLLLDQGRDAEVRERAAQTLKIAKSNHWLLDIALDRLSLGRAHLLAAQRGTAADLADAASHLTASVDGFRRYADQTYLPLGLLGRATLHTHTRDFAGARHDLDEALSLAQRCGFRLHEADAHLGLARLSLAEGALAAALDHLATARKIIDATGYHRRDEELATLEAQRTKQEEETARARGAQGSERIESPLPLAIPAPLAVQSAPASTPSSAPRSDPMPDKYDIAILCAVGDELEKVKETGKGKWTPVPAAGSDPGSYEETVFTTTKGKQLRVVAAVPSQMGMAPAAVLATKMILRFGPALVAMVGIAGGARDDKQNPGDILAPDRTFDYNAGKLTVQEGKVHFEPDFDAVRISERLRGRLAKWSSERFELDDISNGWPIKDQRTRIGVHVGPLGSGAAVIDAKEVVTDVRQHWRKLIGVEMEAYGVHLACQSAVHPAPEFLCIKSISDFAAKKTDEWRDYAAYTAAEFCCRFLIAEWETCFPEPAIPR